MYEIIVTGFANSDGIHVGADTVFVDQLDGELAVFTDATEATRFRASRELLEACLAVRTYFALLARRWEAGDGQITVENGSLQVGPEFDQMVTDAGLMLMHAIDMATARRCPCGALFESFEELGETCGGYMTPEGNGDGREHDHNDNCLARDYICGNGHRTLLCLRRSCPNCLWRGKTHCECHQGAKVEQWPRLAEDYADEPDAKADEPDAEDIG